MKTLPSDPFLRGYLLAAMFTEDPNPRSGEFSQSERPDILLPRIPEDFVVKAVVDCSNFQTLAAKDLVEAVDVHGRDLEACGGDLWYSRNGHGVGFWDRDLGDCGDALDAVAERMGEHDLEFND